MNISQEAGIPQTEGKMNDKLVERVARAMAPTAFEDFSSQKHGSLVNHDFAKKLWLSHAKAAIEAMREPTDAMVYECMGVGGWHYDFRTVWKAGIDAALSERTAIAKAIGDE